MHDPLNLLLWIVIHALGSCAFLNWFYHTNFLAELSNVLPGNRPKMYLRSDFEDWMLQSGWPGWLQALLTCSTCGTAHACGWFCLPTAVYWFASSADASTALSVFLLWAGTCGFNIRVLNK
ncbi:MAG: hypothetical protein ABFD86_22745 [Bryobacteraceae bacterium]